VDNPLGGDPFLPAQVFGDELDGKLAAAAADDGNVPLRLMPLSPFPGSATDEIDNIVRKPEMRDLPKMLHPLTCGSAPGVHKQPGWIEQAEFVRKTSPQELRQIAAPK
jgi:hypothetical protein